MNIMRKTNNQALEAKKLKFIYNASITVISLLACFILDLAKIHKSSFGFLCIFFISSILTYFVYQNYLEEAEDSNN